MRAACRSHPQQPARPIAFLAFTVQSVTGRSARYWKARTFPNAAPVTQPQTGFLSRPRRHPGRHRLRNNMTHEALIFHGPPKRQAATKRCRQIGFFSSALAADIVFRFGDGTAAIELPSDSRCFQRQHLGTTNTLPLIMPGHL